MKPSRFKHIDFLRAISIIGMIVTHALSYSSNIQVSWVWNYIHFVVVGLVISAGYVWTSSYGGSLTSFSSTVSWYKKRISRLLYPYYAFLVIGLILYAGIPKLFGLLQFATDTPFIVKSIFLVGGLDVSWLPLLFVELTLLFPFLMAIVKKKIFLLLYIAGAVAFTMWLTLHQFPANYYRFVMWVPWSLILLISVWLYREERKDTQNKKIVMRYFTVFLFAWVLWALQFLLGRYPNGSYRLIDHKYPPDYYYLSYAMMMTFVCLVLEKVFLVRVRGKVQKALEYISKNSYQLFFIHYVVLSLVRKFIPLNGELVPLLFISLCILCISIGINWVGGKIMALKPTFR